MTKERVIQTFMTEPHSWWVEVMADGKVWITVKETKYLFSLREIVKLCLGLLQMSVKASEILDPMTEAEAVDETTFWAKFRNPDVTLDDLGIELREDAA